MSALFSEWVYRKKKLFEDMPTYLFVVKVPVEEKKSNENEKKKKDAKENTKVTKDKTEIKPEADNAKKAPDGSKGENVKPVTDNVQKDANVEGKKTEKPTENVEEKTGKTTDIVKGDNLKNVTDNVSKGSDVPVDGKITKGKFTTEVVKEDNLKSVTDNVNEGSSVDRKKPEGKFTTEIVKEDSLKSVSEGSSVDKKKPERKFTTEIVKEGSDKDTELGKKSEDDAAEKGKESVQTALDAKMDTNKTDGQEEQTGEGIVKTGDVTSEQPPEKEGTSKEQTETKYDEKIAEWDFGTEDSSEKVQTDVKLQSKEIPGKDSDNVKTEDTSSLRRGDGMVPGEMIKEDVKVTEETGGDVNIKSENVATGDDSIDTQSTGKSVIEHTQETESEIPDSTETGDNVNASDIQSGKESQAQEIANVEDGKTNKQNEESKVDETRTKAELETLEKVDKLLPAGEKYEEVALVKVDPLIKV